MINVCFLFFLRIVYIDNIHQIRKLLMSAPKVEVYVMEIKDILKELPKISF